MDYALDTQSGEKVFPEGAIRHRRYLCPCCRKEVTVRSVDRYSQRVPHFAHLKGRADKNCENFFESISSQVLSVKKFQQLVPKNLELNFGAKIHTGFSKGLYLVLQGDQIQLYFQFHLRTVRSYWTGQITIEALDGVRIFTSNTIIGKHDIPVNMVFTNQSINRFGNVDEEIWSLISSDIPIVSGDYEFFHAPYSNGRMLGNHESIVLGEVYIVSSNSSLDKHPLICSMIEASWKIGGINFFQIRLPNYVPVDSRVLFEQIFTRKISPKRPAFKLLDPLPILIELDGTVRIANSCNLIVLSFDCDPTEIEYLILGGISGLDTVEFNQNFIFVDVANSRGVEIYWQNSLMIRVEKGPIAEIFDTGVILYANGIAHNLLDSASLQSIPIDTEFYLECPLSDIKKNISVSRGFSLLGICTNENRFVSENGVTVDAGSFGSFEFFDRDSERPIAQEKIISPNDNSPVERWIKTLSLVDANINPHLNSEFKANNISKVLNMARYHLKDRNHRKISKGVNK